MEYMFLRSVHQKNLMVAILVPNVPVQGVALEAITLGTTYNPRIPHQILPRTEANTYIPFRLFRSYFKLS